MIMALSRSQRVRRYRKQRSATSLTAAQQRRTRKKVRHARAHGLLKLTK